MPAPHLYCLIASPNHADTALHLRLHFLLQILPRHTPLHRCLHPIKMTRDSHLLPHQFPMNSSVRPPLIMYSLPHMPLLKPRFGYGL